MDTSLLYTKLDDGDRICKLCEQNVDADYHTDECPGKVLEGATYEIRIDGANCGRGCCGYTHTSVEGPALEPLYAEAATAAPDCVYPSYSARLVYEFDNPSDRINAEWKRIKGERDAKEARETAAREAKARAEAKQRARERLELERPDLTPEAYARKLTEVEAMPS